MTDNTPRFQVTDSRGQTYTYLRDVYDYEVREGKLYIFKSGQTEAYGIFFNPVSVLEMEKP
jgi:hypothetical protein